MASNQVENFIDITPAPRVLRVLGEIPFQPWQCLAELIDNGLDALRSLSGDNQLKRVIVSWSSLKVSSDQRTIEVVDTGPGMNLAQIQDSVRAGYTGKDPISTLGLFGMGFNIATARLGDKTTILSTKKGETEWIGTEIDFGELQKSGQFDAPIIHRPSTINEHGTKIIISNLNPSLYENLRKSESQILRTLSDIYTPLLEVSNIEIRIQGKVLSPRRYCVWGQNRSVTASRGKEVIPAVLQIDESIGEALFDSDRNRYLTPDEEDDIRLQIDEMGNLPVNIIRREKRIHGWLGIQRYPHPDDFGIDFVRNGRKILIRDKSLFSYKNEITGTVELEYPVELGGTVGGRIIGEINIDHIPPTYQKNDFDRTDPSWYEVVKLLRGVGPIRPQKRTAIGYTEANSSPLARLIQGYGRCVQGTRYLAAPNDVARKWALEFYKNDPEYIDDKKWWDAAIQAQQQKDDENTPSNLNDLPDVDTGDDSSDDPSLYGPDVGSSTLTLQPADTTKTVEVDGDTDDNNEPDTETDLMPLSEKIIEDSRQYMYPNCVGPIQVNVWKVTQGDISIGDQSPDGVPCILLGEGANREFFYNPNHPHLRQYPTSYRDLLLIELAQIFKARDRLTKNLTHFFTELSVANYPDRQISPIQLQEKATAIFENIRSAAPELLSIRELEVVEFVHETSSEVEEIAQALISNQELFSLFQNQSTGSIQAIGFAPAKTLVRIIERFPEEFFDKKFFRSSYESINFPNPSVTKNVKDSAKERLLSLLKDASRVVGESFTQISTLELERYAKSLAVLEEEIIA